MSTQTSTSSLTAERSTRGADNFFEKMSQGAGILIFVVLGLVAAFLITEALPAFGPGRAELDDTVTGVGSAIRSFAADVGPLIFGTVYAAILALLIATPLAIAIALFISHYAPRELATTLGYLTDILAAVPSVVFGLWGIFVLAPLMVPLMRFFEEYLGWFPIPGISPNFQPFAGPTAGSGRTLLVAAVVLAVMILPIITAISREIFLQTPRLHEEAALALGATRWELIRLAVLPYARSGIISATMLGLGRALGETMALALVLAPAPGLVSFNSISTQNSQAIAPNIALVFPESSGIAVNNLFATGLVLFVITFVVNYYARKITDNEFSGAN